MWILNFLLLILVIYTETICGQCQIDSTINFIPRSPLLFSKSSPARFIYPPSNNRPTILTFAAHENVRLLCPGSTIQLGNYDTKSSMATITCSNGVNFKMGQPLNTLPFNNARCSKISTAAIKRVNVCSHGVRYEIGFEVSATEFATNIDLCFNELLGRTYWAHSVVTTSIEGKQSFPGIPDFRLAGHYANIPIDTSYTRAFQRKRILEIMNNDQAMVNKYIPTTGENYFAKGHLSARADQYYKAQQNSTYYYINSLPMWQSVNNGNWKIIEDNIRNLATRFGDLDIWTGGLRDLHLKDANHQNKQIYLTKRTDTNAIAVTVPRILFKMIVQRNQNRAIVYLTFNNPHATALTPAGDYQLCTEYTACRRNEPRFNNMARGYTYCCLYNDFIRISDVRDFNLPAFNNPLPLV